MNEKQPQGKRRDEGRDCPYCPRMAPLLRLTCLLVLVALVGGCSDEGDQSVSSPDEASGATKEPLPSPVEALLGEKVLVEDYACQEFRLDHHVIESKNPDVQLSVRAPDRFCRIELAERTVFVGQIDGEWFRYGSAVEINPRPPGS